MKRRSKQASKQASLPAVAIAVTTATLGASNSDGDGDVPPNIDDSQSSSDAIVREGANVTLTCKATGSPTPSIRWKRDDNSKITINKSLSVLEWDGETLEMERISRLDMGAYLCIAFNGIPPTVSKQIKVSVDCKCELEACARECACAPNHLDHPFRRSLNSIRSRTLAKGFCQRALHDRFEVKLRSSNAVPAPAPAPAPAPSTPEAVALRPRNALASSDQDYSIKLTGQKFDINLFF
ncbi:hypothetical protein M0804_006400 [Polistes exclamans]|nr:hypothetical protein M0804_006400 [Polistes exclamans]